MARYNGTNGNDTFQLSSTSLSGSTVTAGSGYDTLKISNTGALNFTSAAYRTLTGVDALDFSAHSSGTLTVQLSSSMINQSDNGQITIVSGAGGIDLLKAGTVGGTVFVAGTGNVHLDNATNNVVSLKDGAIAHVMGGSGADTITASATGSLLDGGAGNDTLNAGAGSDTVYFGTGDRADLVQSFNVTQDSVSLQDAGLTHMSQITARLTDGPQGAILDLGNGDTLTFKGVNAASLTADNFKGIAAGAPTIHIAPGTTAAELNAIIKGAGAGATIILDDGHHVFDRSIIIDNDGVTFKGQSESGTVIEFAFPAGVGGHGIEVVGGAKSYLDVTSTDITKGATAITMFDTHGLKAGDTIWLGQPNDDAYLAEHGWSGIDPTKSAGNPFREFIAEIDHVDGNTVFLKSGVPFDMTAGLTQVRSIDLLHNITLSDFTVTFNLGEPNDYNFINAHPEFDTTAAVYVQGTQGANLAHLSVLNAASIAFDIHDSINATADDLFADGTHNKGTDGNGYGLQIYETFDSTFTNLEIFNMRHSVLFSAWDAEAGNYVHVLNTNRDINFHGSEDLNNTVIVDRSVMTYDASQNTGVGTGFWPIVGDGGTVHAVTDIFGNNTVKFGYAVGSDAIDTIFGVDTGAYLNGKNGQDKLFGGAGSDVLVGGLNKDTMSGGGGSDLFLFRQGDNYDTIKDFTTGPAGDKLVITGAATVDAFNDLTLTQNGNDVYVRYGANSTIILENHQVAEISASNFIFDPTGSQYGHLL